MAKNCKLLEEGFSAEYFETRRRESAERARRWTQARYEWELKHVDTVQLAACLLTTVPALIIAAAMVYAAWRM